MHSVDKLIFWGCLDDFRICSNHAEELFSGMFWYVAIFVENMPKISWIVVYGCLYNLPFFIQIDSLAGMASLSLGGSAAPHTQSMQGFPPNLGSAFSTPQSPAKAFPPLSTQNQTTGFSGIGGLSSQLPGTAIWVEWFVFDTAELRHCFCCGWKYWMWQPTP